MSNVTQILSQIEFGDPSATEQLLPLVYDELRKMAAVRLAQERRGESLQATALVHEAYLRLVDREHSRKWNSRGHFFGAAAEAMRRILVENARRRRRVKHGGHLERLDLESVLKQPDCSDQLVLRVDELMNDLAEQNSVAAHLVKLRYFAGCTLPEAARLMDISSRTADRLWAYAKAWLHAELTSHAR